ncbi:MAG: penicillin-binding protein 2 [Bifidobacteriaceae bacterium]|jgi:cell division protein FtsI (penicillin-binding protein 3)|nr:penicillin-binding protein 2 [Bifidobacteriaceae bacterium]
MSFATDRSFGTKPRKHRHTPARRQRPIRVLLVLALLVCCGRLVQLQVVDASALAAEGVAMRTQTVKQPAERGDIETADGTVLATDVVRYRVEANQTQVKTFTPGTTTPKGTKPGAEGAAQLLAPLLGLSEDQAYDKLNGTKKYVVLLGAATASQWTKINELGVTGVYGTLYYERTYPGGAVAGNIIGYPYMGSGDKDTPTHYTGLEETEDKLLTGTDGKLTQEVDPSGVPIVGGESSGTAATAGCDVQLTINADLQWEAQQAIDQQVKATGADSGEVVVVDVKTGELLALADSGTVNPLTLRDTKTGTAGSPAVQDVFEPGSTGKVVTMSEILETGTAKATSKYSVPSQITVGGQVFHDDADHGTSQWTLTGILAQSSNDGTVIAAKPIPDQTRYDYLRKFGFGSKTGVELPGESAGLVPVPNTSSWDGRTRNTILFGQGVAVTALQATGVYATIGDGGVAMPMHLVKSWTCPDGKSGQTPIGSGTRVVSKKTAKTISSMLEAVVESGTGQTAQITGYRIAGKTGTAEQISQSGTKYVSSFIGFAPAQAPEVAVGVIVHNAKTSSWGSTVAAPVFKDVTSFAMETLGVPPSTSKAHPPKTTW